MFNKSRRREEMHKRETRISITILVNRRIHQAHAQIGISKVTNRKSKKKFIPITKKDLELTAS